MTLIEKNCATTTDKMDRVSPSKEERGKSSRPVRNRRYTRRSIIAGQRPQKRLFTPEIKRYLKDWLVRRRDNPYPNREEKKYLAYETGLTYIQICNWFANWRRKLKNVNADRKLPTWGHLIRTYNYRAQGNVEQFSICSNDSIWSEPELTSTGHDSFEVESGNGESSDQTRDCQDDSNSSGASKEQYEIFNNNYDMESNKDTNLEGSKNSTSPLMLSKWLESAARFQPSEMNYSWWADGRRRKEANIRRMTLNAIPRHGRDEVEAAVALTTLATAASRVTAP